MATPPRTARPQKADDAGVSTARIRLGRVFRVESKDYFLLLGTTLFLAVFGLVMVLSSSSVESNLEDGGFFVQATRQGLYALFGVPIMLIASRMPERMWMTVAWPLLIVACALQLLVVATPLGITVGGNTNWLAIGQVQFQPSELIKVALVIWLGLIVTKKQALLGDFTRGILPILLVGGGAIGLVLLGGDLGTVMIMGAMLLGALFLIGVRFRLLLPPVLLGTAVFVIVAVSSDSRMRRITAFLQENCTQFDNEDCWQIQHGRFALANGGILGVGLGNSTAKWSWLPAADNDFIFAIIGEELGLIGAVVVIGLFVVLAVAFARMLRAARTPFAKAVTAAVLVWVVGQACVNIAVVLGVFPVLGVPLPLVSAGGSALITTLFAIGIVLSFARDPEAATRAAARAEARATARAVGHQARDRLPAGRRRNRGPRQPPARRRRPPARAAAPTTRCSCSAPPRASSRDSCPSAATSCSRSRRCRSRVARTGRPLRSPPGSGRSIDDVSAIISTSAVSTSSSASAATSRRRPTSPRVERTSPWRSTRPMPGRASRTDSEPGGTPPSASPSAARRCAHAEVVGMPLRREIETLDRAALRDEAARFFGLDPARPVLLATGGSLGARRINRTMVESAGDLTGAGWQVLHFTGAASDVDDPGLPGYRMAEYADRMDLALAVADLAVSRAGAATVSELAALGIPAVYVPYPVGNGEQRFNAARRGGRGRRHPRRRRRVRARLGAGRAGAPARRSRSRHPDGGRRGIRRPSRRHRPHGRPRRRGARRGCRRDRARRVT